MFVIDGDIELSEMFDGEIDCNTVIDGDIDLENVIDGEMADFVYIKDYSGEIYDGTYRVIPKTFSQILDTSEKLLTNDITVVEIPYYETGNESGTTVYIANSI